MDYLVYTNVTIYHMETRGLVFVYYTTSNNNNYFLMHIHFSEMIGIMAIIVIHTSLIALFIVRMKK